MLNTRAGWDTHDTNTDQAALPRDDVRRPDAAARRPRGAPRARGRARRCSTTPSWSCFSEFVADAEAQLRTHGKDHWPVTSAMVIGAGVKGGRAFGATTDGLEAAPVDFATGARSPAARR